MISLFSINQADYQGLNVAQLDQMRCLFAKFDKNRDGRISIDELREAFAKIGDSFLRVSRSDAELKRIVILLINK